ncbi:MAG: penicillin-binding protein 2 [Proteobacteria bacterium]|nr:penicillin-binding protein 2 [Pseudomonadota bacterium]
MKIPRSPFSEDTEDFGTRHAYLILAALVMFFFLMVRLWYLQIIRGPDFREMSESNRTRAQDIVPARGLILDRNGQLLADDHPSFELWAIREDVPDMGNLIDRLALLVNVPWDETRKNLEEAMNRPAFKPTLLMSGLSREKLVAFETHRYELPGLFIQDKPQRRYLKDELASHVIGYLSEVTQDELEHPKYADYRMRDMVGRCGVEQEWETSLFGQRGQRLVEVDASGRVLKVIHQQDSIPGHNLFLTIDSDLQRVAQEALGEEVGAVVALDPKTGEVLAMASRPTFSPNEFIRGITSARWRELSSDSMHPLENRAVSGQYPPGSTFKIVSAIAGLAEGIITPETPVYCTGGYKFGDRVFRCWRKGGHGRVTLHRALVESCDVYFYDLGRRLGVDRLAKWSQAFGLGDRTGVGLANEKSGLVPSQAWKKRRFKAPWHKGETLSVIIGQGYNLATPLQMARVIATVFNGGILYRPHLVKLITDAEGRPVKKFEPEALGRLDIRPEYIEAVRQGLTGVVNEPGGTGRRARVEGVIVAGKTGTAQVVAQHRFEERKGDMPYEYRDHAWFVACAPVDNPRIAVAVVVEHGGHGGSAAAPVAQKVMDAFFNSGRAPAMIAVTGDRTQRGTRP